MTTLSNWLSPTAMHSLGWTLVHFVWQGTALAAIAAIAMAGCRRASARYVIGSGVLGLMLVAPFATFLLLQRPASTESAGFPAAQAWPASKLINEIPAPSRISSSVSSSPDIFAGLIEAWLIGVAFFSLRTAGGFVLLERRQCKQSTLVSDKLLAVCLKLQHRLGISRAIRFCECKWLQAPAVLGWFRPVVLLPLSTLTGLSGEQLESVIAHELAHIKRLDAFVNIFQVGVETLLFYHPAIWWLNKRIRAEREHCCDDMAIALCGNAVEYARALTLMEEWRSLPALAMAANGGSLSGRIGRLLGLNPDRSSTRRAGLTGSVLCMGAALVAGSMLLGIAYPKPIVYASGSTLGRITFTANTGAMQSLPAMQVASTPSAKPSPEKISQPAEKPETPKSYIDALQSAGLKDLTPDELIALKIQDVTAEYVRGMSDLGLHPNADDLVTLKIQGVTPDYIKGFHSLGFHPDEQQIVALKIQGLTADYVRGLKDIGIQGDIDQLIALKVQGVTVAYVQGLDAQGLHPTLYAVMGMRIQGVTPEYIRDIRALGLNPGADEIIGMKVQDVTPEYIKTLQAAGFKLSIGEIIKAKIQDITPEFIEMARKHGFQNLTIDKLIELKNIGVLEDKGNI